MLTLFFSKNSMVSYRISFSANVYKIAGFSISLFKSSIFVKFNFNAILSITVLGFKKNAFQVSESWPVSNFYYNSFFLTFLKEDFSFNICSYFNFSKF